MIAVLDCLNPQVRIERIALHRKGGSKISIGEVKARAKRKMDLTEKVEGFLSEAVLSKCGITLKEKRRPRNLFLNAKQSENQILMDEAAMQKLTSWLLSETKVTKAAITVPEGVEASVRTGEGKTVHILVNFADKVETVVLPSPMIDELHGKHSVRTVVLPISGVAVLSEPR